MAIGNIGNGNTFTLETLAIRTNPVGDTKKGEKASCLFQRDKSGVVERGCAGAADVGGKFIEGEALGAGDCLVASHIWFAIAGRSEQQKVAGDAGIEIFAGWFIFGCEAIGFEGNERQTFFHCGAGDLSFAGADAG